jgi:hypothetical protein
MNRIAEHRKNDPSAFPCGDARPRKNSNISKTLAVEQVSAQGKRGSPEQADGVVSRQRGLRSARRGTPDCLGRRGLPFHSGHLLSLLANHRGESGNLPQATHSIAQVRPETHSQLLACLLQ